jgi:hypothetical protein
MSIEQMLSALNLDATCRHIMRPCYQIRQA